MSRKFRAEQHRARTRMREWRRGQRFRGRARLYLSLFSVVGSVTFLLVLLEQLR